MSTQMTTTPTRRAISPQALTLLAAVAIVLSTLLGASDAAAGKNQGNAGGNRMIIIGG